jgi:hypothetical protein
MTSRPQNPLPCKRRSHLASLYRQYMTGRIRPEAQNATMCIDMASIGVKRLRTRLKITGDSSVSQLSSLKVRKQTLPACSSRSLKNTAIGLKSNVKHLGSKTSYLSPCSRQYVSSTGQRGADSAKGLMALDEAYRYKIGP